MTDSKVVPVEPTEEMIVSAIGQPDDGERPHYNLHRREALLVYKAMLAAAPTSEQWQDISTAPKDGTWVMFWNALEGWPRLECYVMGYWWDGGIIEGKHWNAGWWSASWGYIAKPTHWKPLPIPPAPKEQTK